MKVRLINQISGLTISKMKVLIRSYMTPNPLIGKDKASFLMASLFMIPIQTIDPTIMRRLSM